MKPNQKITLLVCLVFLAILSVRVLASVLATFTGGIVVVYVPP